MLAERTMNEFFEVLASSAPAPGGGSASALLGSCGCALLEMVASLTKGKEKYQNVNDIAIDTIKEAKKYRDEFLRLIDEDVEAFNLVSKVYSMKKDTDEEKKLRRVAMQKALKNAINPPFRMMKLSRDVLIILNGVVDLFNKNALSDIGVASLCLKSSIQGAWLNVLINLGSIKDEDFVKINKHEGENILKDTLELADAVYRKIEQSL